MNKSEAFSMRAIQANIAAERGLKKPGGSEKADIVWTNGIIYTADAEDSFAEAIAVKESRFLFVGSSIEAATLVGKNTTVIDLEGKMVLPGMFDSHIHAPGNILAEKYLINLNGIMTEEETMKSIEAFVKSNPGLKIYYGEGFSIGAFSGEELSRGPRKERLDAITGKPLIITSYDCHIRWLNSSAFNHFAITAATITPPGGVIELTDDGELWGTLKESAIELAPQQEFSAAELAHAYHAFQDYLHSLGYVGITDMGSGILVRKNDDPFISMGQADKLRLYVTKNTILNPNKELDCQLLKAQANRDNCRSDLYNADSIKIFADGVVEGMTAYLLEPYASGAGKESGFVSEPLWAEEKMKEAFAKANAAGFQLHVHSIGDAATHQVLNAFEYALEKNGPGDYRNVVTHLQIVDPADIPRFARLGIIANMQPYWAFKDPGWWNNVDRPLLGTERAEREYPMQSLVSSGGLLVSSSDHGVTPHPNPFLAIATGMTRNLCDPEGCGVEAISNCDDPTWLLNRQERVSLIDMLRSFTINAAFQNHREKETGSIEVGKNADFIVISQNLFEVDPLAIAQTKVLTTTFRGEVVWQAGHY